jgi:hypothetical protein
MPLHGWTSSSEFRNVDFILYSHTLANIF